jgi:hypothetical protein
VRRAVPVAALLLFGACSSNSKPVGFCESNAECLLPGTRCDTEQKLCVCTTDEACKMGEFCNTAGVCQAKAGCGVSDECPSGTFCDPDSGKCLSGPPLQLHSACGLASHCAYGTVCVAGQCEAGCFDDGDCVLGEICQDGFCAGGANICSNDSFCEYRARCAGGQCRRDLRGPYCRGCSQPTVLNPAPCDDPRNFCLVNSAETGGFPFFCGVDCSLGQPCPNGFVCNRILIVTDVICTHNAQCKCDPAAVRFATRTCTVADPCRPTRPDGTPDPDANACFVEAHPDCNPPEGGQALCVVARDQRSGSCTCDTNDDCGADSMCVDGLCCTGEVDPSRECRVGEGRVSGFCNCGTDDDCPRDSCDSSRGFCIITGRPCTPGMNDCGPIPCVEGACLIGENCAPDQGLSCSIVTSGG